MDHRFIAANHLVSTLRHLTGYPRGNPTSYTHTFSVSGQLSSDDVRQLASVAKYVGVDLIHLAFDDVSASDHPAISLMVHDHTGIRWIPDVRLWAEGEVGPVEFLAENKRWSFATWQRLIPRAAPSVEVQAKGEAIAMRRWREMAAIAAPGQLIGSPLALTSVAKAGDIELNDIRIAG